MKSFEEILETTRLVRNVLWQYVYERGDTILGYVNRDCKCGGDSSCKICYGTNVFNYAVAESDCDNGDTEYYYIAFIDGDFVVWWDKEWSPLSIWPQTDYEHYAVVISKEDKSPVPAGPFSDLREVGAGG